MKLMRDIFNLFKIKNGGILFTLYVLVLCTSILPYNIYITTFFCVCVLFFCKIQSYTDKTALFLILFSVLYSTIIYLSDDIESYFLVATYLLAPFSFYVYGRYIAKKIQSENQFISLILTTILLFGILLYTLIINDIQQNGFVNITRQIIVYGNDAATSATLLGVNASLGFIGIVAFFAIKGDGAIIKRLLFLLIGIASIATVLQLVNRTGFVVVFCSTVIGVIYLSKARVLRFFFIVVSLLAIDYLAIEYGVLGEEVFSAYESRNSDGLNTAGGRSFRWIDAIEKLLIYPIGWKNDITTFNDYVHNFWLDVARVAGIFPFFFLAIANIRAMLQTKTIFFNTTSATGCLIVALNVCFFITLFVEPIMEGFPLYLYLYCMLWGMQKEYGKAQNIL